MLIDLIAGARPNFMKIAPIIHAIKDKQNQGAEISFRLIHTGQHYDTNMSGQFFEELNIPDPDFNLGVGSGSQAEQTAAIMIGYEKLLLEESPELCIVVGDVTSTMACAITAKKLHIKVAHVEAGIRSGDWKMPEEINRIVTDSITNYFFTTSEMANIQLRKDGVNEENIFFVGNTMIDTLLANENKLKEPEVWDRIGLKEKKYLVLTLHRPNNVDAEISFKELMKEIVESVGNDFHIVFPMHPRTKVVFKKLNIEYPNLHILKPLGYLEFNYLVKNAKAVITDSGGITEETTVLGVPCLTIRDSTERPETVTIGTNELLGSNPKNLSKYIKLITDGNWKRGKIPDKWDGKAANRIVDILLSIKSLNKNSMN